LNPISRSAVRHQVGAATTKPARDPDSVSELPHRCFGSHIVRPWRDATWRPESPLRAMGFFPRVSARVRCSSESGRRQARPVCPKSADIVAKVENRATQKISPKPISGLLRCCIACQRHCGDLWSILNKTIWSLTSPRAIRISGSKNFRASPQKDFCNNICQQRKSAARMREGGVRSLRKSEHPAR
jgi:hypothetical protein